MSKRFASLGLTAIAAVSALTLALPASSAAQPKPKPQRQCFSANSVNGFTPVDDRHVNLTVGVNQIYQLTLFSDCRDIDWTWRLGVRARGGGSFICSGLDAEIIVPDRNFPQRCMVTDVRRLSPEEVKAAQTRKRPQNQSRAPG